MSLTNPNKVVTEERLAEFYGQILPYLGGMPEAIANKFSRSALYSTDEKIVGCWTDGKPIYQKTFTTTMPTGTGTVSKNISIGASVDNYIFYYGIYRSNAGADVIFPTPYDALFSDVPGMARLFARVNSASTSPNTIILTTNNPDVKGCSCRVIIQYTKTTDSANSFNFSTETDYSTTEHIVGTWIDGKPLYQKTMDCGTMPSSATTKDVSHGISNIDYIVSINGFYRVPSDSNKFSLPLSYNSGDSTQSMQAWANKSVVRLWAGQNRSTYRAYVTLQYTKTTD